MIDGTKLKDVEYRKQLAAGGKNAIDDSNDPLIELAKNIDEEAREVRKRYEEEVVAVERGNYAKIARALFEEQGTSLYPDATFTLRLSYGAVKGYQENGKWVAPFTTLGGLYERSNKFNQSFPITCRRVGPPSVRPSIRARHLISFPPMTLPAATAARRRLTKTANWSA